MNFPSTLPPQTVLDCILDDNWRDNRILHVLDVISWKGQDLADCKTPSRSVRIDCMTTNPPPNELSARRFWWCNTGVSELDSFPQPLANAAPSTAQSP
ncbi:hypothetical protein L226DRAFT_540490 [Lentinus tigrinus ALCF2SS1-7]|uniref:Snurportin-1 m3G cap-binding domain-containing protein n=1 Tax=Lentinus tigrinus ALCF2SS1-6 TaxID=1328759 RepID=A0A5C2RQH9_9APHY|nr:hypothetical protein L227DRAFT_581354 [Lentinus tigrinus ALCF2SS1-6]RPD68675.1 hypothetical protein L226DRAFT_540490 [Lentinus tigrinus ALCF2SS1-7]